MNLVKAWIITAVLVNISTATTTIIYILPDNSSNISCPSHQCATFSQYFLDNDTLPVVSNVEYYLLPGKHYVISTEVILLGYLQNFSLVGYCNKQLQQFSSTILLSTDIIISDSYNITIKNIIIKMLYRSIRNVKLQLVVCISCTMENVTLLGCGLLGYNLIRRSYLTNIVIKCNRYQGIMLEYGYYPFNDSITNNKSIVTIQNISVYYDGMCHTDIYREIYIIYIDIEKYLTVDSIEIIISNSQFHAIQQPIIYIHDDSKTISCIVSIIHCRFENVSVSYTPIIKVMLTEFNMALNFLNCEFHYCNGSNIYKYLIAIIVTSEMKFKNDSFNKSEHEPCTNISFSKCRFSNNNAYGGLLYISTQFLPDYKSNVLFIGPIYINHNSVSTYSASDNMKNLIYIDSMAVQIYGPINISDNMICYDIVVCNDIMVFELCEIFIKGPITISSNFAFERNVMLLESCNVSFQGPITISHNIGADSIILFAACDITFDKQIMFISNICNKVINIKSQYTYIKLMQGANITFLANEYSYIGDIIVLELNDDYNKPYPYCLFQYMTAKANASVEYTIIFNENKIL